MKNTVMDKLKLTIDRITASRKAMIISGTVCAVPFVFEKLFLLSWVMYIPVALLFFTSRESIKKETSEIFLFGYAYYLVGYFWISELYPMDFAGFSRLQCVFVIVFALTAVPSLHSGMLVLSYVLCKKAAEKMPDMCKLFVFPCVIVFAEFLQSVGPLAFPWCRVYVAQAGCNAVIQSASLFGSYFIAYIVLLVNALLAYAVFDGKMRKVLVISAVAVFCINIVFGVCRISILEKQIKTADKFTAIALQGNIPSDEKWGGSTQSMVDLYMNLAESAVNKAEADGMSENKIVLIPETAFPFNLREGGKTAFEIAEFSKENSIYFAAGAFSEQGTKDGNSVFVFSPGGKMSKPYTKRHLVPFGEYLPYRLLFETFVPPLAEMNVLSSDLYAAKETAVFELDFAKAGAVICYESIFPELCRESVADGAEILLVSTNDSWFGTSGALRHHLYNAKLRAVENGVPVIRAANTGISALIQPNGRIVQSLGADERGFILSELAVCDGKTLYTAVGDVWLLLCVTGVAITYMCGASCRKNKINIK